MSEKREQAIHTASAGDRGLRRERLELYPRNPDKVMPTRFGNAMKAAETYGNEQYDLDVALLWTRITAVASDPVRDQLNQSRSVIDFFVGLWWLSIVFSVAAVFSGLYHDHPVQWAYVGVALLIAPYFAYPRAIKATAWYREAVRALADLSRSDLAESMGLEMPDTLAEEREMWHALSNFVAWGPYWAQSDTWAATLEQFRKIESAEQ